jgi:hypothetical protein
MFRLPVTPLLGSGVNTPAPHHLQRRLRSWRQVGCWLLMLGIVACGTDQSQPASAWQLHIIDDSLAGADGVDLWDVDDDGDADAVVGWEESRAIRLYLNPGAKTTGQRWPATDISGGLSVGKVEDALFVDLDADGRPDGVFSAAEKGPERIGSYRAAVGADPGDPASWSGAALTGVPDYRYVKLSVGDLDGDGHSDLVAGAKTDGQPGGLVWLRNPAATGGPATAWDATLIDELEWVDSLLLEDLDGDGRRDVLVNHDGFLGWYRNPGAAGGRWQRQLVSDSTGPYFARCPRDDGGLTLVAGADLSGHGPGDTLLYLVQRAPGATAAWTVAGIPSRQGVPRQVDSRDYQVKGLACGAIDDNPLPDVAVSVSGRGAGVFVALNLDVGDPVPLELLVIAGTQRNSRKGIKYDNLHLVDVDLDGDLDLVTTEENGRGRGPLGRFLSPGIGVLWYENPLRKTGQDLGAL